MKEGGSFLINDDGRVEEFSVCDNVVLVRFKHVNKLFHHLTAVGFQKFLKCMNTIYWYISSLLITNIFKSVSLISWHKMVILSGIINKF